MASYGNGSGSLNPACRSVCVVSAGRKENGKKEELSVWTVFMYGDGSQPIVWGGADLLVCKLTFHDAYKRAVHLGRKEEDLG